MAAHPVDPDRLADLSLEDKAALTAGRDVWTVPGIPALGVPPLRMTDGPNGARGTAFRTGAVRSVAVPCGAALSSSFDPELVERVGALLGREARQKRSRVLLAPTINLTRSPLYGRSFECYGEDPWLSGRLAAAFVTGVQSEGVATTAKHLVGNEAEFQRMTIDSVIEERTLREVYLVPFEWAVRHGNTLGIMTSYNRLNGTYCTEDRELLTDIIRDEWGFEGFFVSDWFAAGETIASLEAGLDVQMPGPDRWFGGPVAKAVANGETEQVYLDAIVDRRLALHETLDAWDDDLDQPEAGVETEADRALAHEAAVAGTVLLRNDGLLPLDPQAGSVALIGPNAVSAHIMGGGSAQLASHRRVPPAAVFEERLGERVRVERGCIIDKQVPPIRPDQGFEIEFFIGDDWSGEVAATASARSGRAIWAGEPAPGLGTEAFTCRMSGSLTITESGTHTFSLIQLHGARLIIDGEVLIDGIAIDPPKGEAYFGQGSIEMIATLDLEVGQRIDVVIECAAAGGTGIRGVTAGHQPPVPADLIDRAAAAAAAADVAVVIVGTSSEWETEGNDRESMDLPGDQDVLVSAVCAANPRTVVVVNTGSPVHMPWIEQPAAILLPWLGGQEMAPALFDVLFGAAEPGGRLSTTFPLRIEHTPAYGNFPGEANRTLYGEGLLMGNRWYASRRLPVAFPFGHGLSYTTFEWEAPRLVDTGPARATVEVEIANTGDRPGAEVVQLYLSPPAGVFERPTQQLIGSAKVHLDAGERRTIALAVSPRSLAYWNPANLEHLEMTRKLTRGDSGVPLTVPPGEITEPGWYVDAGAHELRVARSATDIVASMTLDIAEPQGPLTGAESLP